MITVSDYEKAIKDRYALLKDSGTANSLVIEPTPAGLKRYCLLMLPELNESDLQCYKHFFGFTDDKSFYKQIESFDTSKFKALCNFLNGDSGKSAIERLDILAILVNVEQRPFNKFRKHDIPSNSYSIVSEVKEYETIAVRDNIVKASVENEISIKQRKPLTLGGVKRFLKSQGNGFFAFTALLIFGSGYVAKNTFFNENECMVWKKDHYEEVSCNVEVNTLAGNTIIPVNEDLFAYQKKVAVTDTTTFFNADGSARYGMADVLIKVCPIKNMSFLLIPESILKQVNT